MSIFAPSPAGGSAQGSLPPDGHPCKAEKSPLVTPLPPPEVSALGDAAAGAGSGPCGRAGPGCDPGGDRAVPPLPSRVLPARSHPRARTPTGRAERSPRPCPGPFRRPPRARSAPLRCRTVPCRAGRPRPCAAGKRRGSGAPPSSARAPRGPPHTRGGDREAEELRPAGNGSGRGCALPGSPPGGEERGGCHRPSCTTSRVLRPRGIAGAASATEGRDAHVGPAPRSPTVSRRRPAAQGPTARCGARQHAALAGLRAAAERRAQRRVRRGEYAGAAPSGCAIGRTRGTLSREAAGAVRDGTGREPERGLRSRGAGAARWAGRGCPAALALRGAAPARRPSAGAERSGAAGTERGRAPQRSPTARHGAPLTGEGMESTHPPGTEKHRAVLPRWKRIII